MRPYPGVRTNVVGILSPLVDYRINCRGSYRDQRLPWHYVRMNEDPTRSLSFFYHPVTACLTVPDPSVSRFQSGMCPGPMRAIQTNRRVNRMEREPVENLPSDLSNFEHFINWREQRSDQARNPKGPGEIYDTKLSKKLSLTRCEALAGGEDTNGSGLALAYNWNHCYGFRMVLMVDSLIPQREQE